MEWHALSEKEVIEKINSGYEGLKASEASLRLSEYGENTLKRTRHFEAVKRFFSQFKSFLIVILIIAAIVSFLMHSVIDSVVILAIIILNAGLGFFQEYKAEKAIEELKKMMVNRVKVIRDSRIIEIDSKKVVPGDILVLGEGDKIVADARVLKSEGLKVNESSLTGESIPEEKISRTVKLNVPLTERLNMVYQGTQVVSGSGLAVVIDTGMRTEFGKISDLVQRIQPEENPFKEKLDSFGRRIAILVLFLSFIMMFLLSVNGVRLAQSFLVSVSLAVSAIPEGLPAIISLGLAFATKRMIRKNVLVRKLPASETLGRVTVICTDKTGTLTEENMKVVKIYTDGSFNPGKEKNMLFRVGVLCNNAHYNIDNEGEHFIGDPTEKALLLSARENFIDKKALVKEQPRVKEFSFNSDRKMMSVIRKSNKRVISYVKGAPENIITRCNYELINGKRIRLCEEDKKRLISSYEEMAREGLRVLGFAYKIFDIDTEKEKLTLSEEEAENDLVFVGFQGMIDPPRKEVRQALKLCEEAGIKVLMITGDSKLTAEAVAKDIGLKGKSIDSKMLDKMTDRELFHNIKDISIFSRISPESKLRIINILKQRNEIVAMTGDGVNDALALKRADIGIAMGIRGTDVARDSSDLILTDDNFSSIVEGVSEGRRIYDNIKKSIKYLLSSNFSEVIIVLLVMLIWRDPYLLPLLPLQILWINLVTDSLPALALASEPAEKGIMQKKPSKKGILYGIKGFIFVSGIIAAVIGLIFFYLNKGDIAVARTMVVTGSILFQMFLVFNCKSEKSVFKSPFNKYILYAVLVSISLHFIVMYTGLNTLFYFTMLNLGQWIQLLGVSFTGFLIIEGYKTLKREG